MTTAPPAEGYARAVATTSPHVRDGVLWLTWKGEYILTSSLDFSLPFGDRVAETMAFPSNPTGTVLDWGELATVGPHDHAGCIRAAGYEPTLEEA